MIVLGIDPGTAQTGYGVVRAGMARDPRLLIECGGGAHPGTRSPALPLAHAIFDGICELVERHHPDALASVEDEDILLQGVSMCAPTIVLGHARGVVLLAGEQRAIPHP